MLHLRSARPSPSRTPCRVVKAPRCLLMASLVLLSLFYSPRLLVEACTDILVTPGASVDGSAIIAYNADSPTLYGVLYHYPPSKNTPGTERHVYDWDSGVYLGKIEEAEETYNVIGNSNEHGLVIGESTFGGVSVLAWNQTGAIIDYGSLIYLTLQRATTARAAITVMVDLMDTYGYYSGGESFSLMDRSGEVWIMEVIGRGNDFGKKGAVWVAQRIPDGAVAAHANQARITTFPRNDPNNFLFAEDVVEVAIFYGLFSASADPGSFSFSDVYDPITFIEARQGEARVWSIFSAIADKNGEFQRNYLSYALGEETDHRMPLYIIPCEKLSVMDVMHLMTSHYEETPLDSSVDVGSGLFETPYRPRPLVWEFNGTKYHNERSIATAKTGWSFVAQARPWMPPELAAVSWFACDDSSTAPRVPVYGSSKAVSAAYAGQGSQDGVFSPLLTFDLTKAFWVQNMVSNFCYYRYNDVYPMVRRKITSIQREFNEMMVTADERALTLYNEMGPDKAIDFVTLFSVNAGNSLHKEWMEFYGYLFARFRDFYTITAKGDEPVCGCVAQEPGLSESVKKRIVAETGNHYKVLDNGGDHPDVVSGESPRHKRDTSPKYTTMES
jgi:dipeptidase